MRYFNPLCLAVIMTAFLLSCSGGADPVLPQNQPSVTPSTVNSTAPPVERISWGTWDITIDPLTGEVETVPCRGASFQANVVNFLQPPSAPVNLLGISIDGVASDIPEGFIVCDVSISHPFPGTKFCGFDVMGVVFCDWPGYTFASDPDIVASRAPETILCNADGWTRWWNQPEFTTYGTLLGYIDGNLANTTWTSTHTLNAFKYFSDDLDPEDAYDPDPALRGFFSSEFPGINTRRYELQFQTDPNPVFRFKYAISANWIAPIDGSTSPYTPNDWTISANMPEAYRIDIEDVGSTAFYQNTSTFGGDLELMVDIYDWQFDGSLSHVSDEITSVTIESPNLFPSPVNLDLSTAELHPANETCVRIPFSINDVTPDSVYNQLLIVTVESAKITDYSPQIDGISGFDYPTGSLAAYSILEAPIAAIGPQNTAPVADASATDPTSGTAPLNVSLDPSLSYDTDGTIVLYEWDFESDGTYDDSTTTPDPVDHIFSEGVHTVTLRVTDNDDATDTDEITINAGCVSTPGWPTFRHDNKRTGRTSIIGPETENLRFQYPGTAAIIGGIAIDSLTRALFRSNDGNINCVDMDGVLVWSYQIGGTWDYATPAITPEGDVIVGNSGGEIWCFDSEGTYKWHQDYGLGGIGGGVAILDNGQIMFTTSSGYLVKTFSDGSIDWTFPTGSTMPNGPTVDENNVAYIANHAGRVYAVDENGGEIWMTQCGYSEMSATPALSSIGLFIGDWGGHVYRLDPVDGDVEWDTYLSPSSISCFPAVDCENYVYIGSRDDYLYCLSQDNGDVEWSYQTCGDIGSTSPVLDGDGKVFCGAYCGVFYCFDAYTGDLIWEYDTGTGPSNAMYCKSPAMTDDGTIVMGTNDGILFGWQDE